MAQIVQGTAQQQTVNLSKG